VKQINEYRPSAEAWKKLALAALACGAAALGAGAVGALVIGRLRIGKLSVRSGIFEKLEVDELIVRRIQADNIVGASASIE
jgi:hypothetical protein